MVLLKILSRKGILASAPHYWYFTHILSEDIKCKISCAFFLS